MRQHKKKRSEEVAFHFGKNLARARRRAGLSQEELGQRASLHRTEIGMLEHGQRVARIDTVTKLAGAMAIASAELLEGIHWTPRNSTGGGFSFTNRHGFGCERTPTTRTSGRSAKSDYSLLPKTDKHVSLSPRCSSDQSSSCH